MKSSSLLSLLFFVLTLGGLAGCARNEVAVHRQQIAPAQTAPATPPVRPATDTANLVRAEQIRADCIRDRRVICGRVFEVATNGLVVDSGYTDLLRPPLGQSWVIPGTVAASRSPGVLELNEPGTPAIGLIFLTDLPKRRAVKKFDYVVLIGYPAGPYVYEPLPGVKKTIRKFAAGLDTAVRLSLLTEETSSAAHVPPAQ